MISREERIFLENLEKLFNENELVKPYFKEILAFGAELMDTNILVMNPELKSRHAFEWNTHWNNYYDKYIQEIKEEIN